MNNYKSQEKTIDVKSLLITYFKKWRIILIAMIIGAVLLGGVKLIAFISESQSTDGQQQTATESSSEYDELLEVVDLAKENLETQRDNLITYESLLNEAKDLNKTTKSDEAKASLLARITELTNKVLSIELEIENSEKLIEDYELQLEELSASDMTAAESETRSIGDAVKFAVIGAVLGAFAVACYVLVKFLLNKKIEGADSVRERYNISVLADLHVSESKHKCKIDLLLEKWNGEVRKIDEAAEYELLAAKLQAICPDEKKEILLCGSVNIEIMNKLCVGINKYLGDGVTTIAAGNPVCSAEAARAAKNANAVLIEKVDESAYIDTDQIMEQLTLSKAQILGSVLV